jgi:hypothetical protein
LPENGTIAEVRSKKSKKLQVRRKKEEGRGQNSAAEGPVFNFLLPISYF